MKISILPKTNLGKWSFALIIISALSMLIFIAMILLFNQRGGETFFSNLFLTVPMLIVWAAGTIAFITGVISIFKSKDYAVLVFLAAILGFLIFFYGLLEIILPH